MRNLDVQLISQARDILNEAASVLNMEPEQAFEYVVRNALTAYHVVELRGYMRLVDNLGRVEALRFSHPKDSSSVVKKVISRLRRQPKQFKPATLASERFSALVDPQLIEDVELQAKLYGFSQTDLINRLVTIGGTLAIHLKDGQAFAFSETHEPLGKIEFKA